MMKQELTYWFTLAMIPGIWTRRKNEIYVKCYNHIPRISIIRLFEEPFIWKEIGLDENEIELFSEARKLLPNNSFLVEELLSQGYNIIPIDSPDYPQTLKTNLKTGAPSILFTKGNIGLLKQSAVAIVGSRKADELSMIFTRNVSRKTVEENKVVVSGYAKGVDRQALDTAVECNGKSIIVLPQGITTFGSGFKKYYKQIMQGDVLVISTFHPKAPWSVEFAMARNSTIYGIANYIYVAKSEDKGGTWSGVNDGLKKGREVYIRMPEKNEKSANLQLIMRGAKPVDVNGCNVNFDMASTSADNTKDNNVERIIEFLRTGPKTSKEIINFIEVPWSDSKMKKYLRQKSNIEEYKNKNKIYFHLKGSLPPDLFGFK